jgi:hypothetical protein
LGLSSLLVDIDQGTEPLTVLMMAAGLAAAGMLLLPSAGYALWRLLGREVKDRQPLLRGLRPTLLIFAFPLVLLLGYWVIDFPALSWLVIPSLHVVAIGLPVLWVLYLGVRDLPLGSPQRKWGVFGSGLALGPMVIIIFEGLALVAFAILAGILIAGQADLLQELNDLAEWMRNVEPTPEMLLDRIGPYLTRPGVISAVLVFGALIVPLIEEALKPIGVWLLAGRTLGPAAGFAAGALSGAGYALFESLAITTGIGDWVMLVVVRIGTAMIHILTAGLVGWALVLAWERGRYLNLGLTFLFAVAIHGLWNGLTLLNSFALLSQELGINGEGVLLPGLASAAPYVLVGMATAALVTLIAFNRRLARSSEPQKNLAEMAAPAQTDGTEYNPPAFAQSDPRATAGVLNGDELDNDRVDPIPD